MRECVFTSYVPTAHPRQKVPLFWCCPFLGQSTHTVAGKSFRNRPAGHLLHAEAPTAFMYSPSMQGKQYALPVAFCENPTKQLLHAVFVLSPTVAKYFPALQGLQLSLVLDAGVLE